MKRLSIVLLALGVVFFLGSTAMAGKSVVSIVKSDNQADLDLLANDFHFNADVSKEQTVDYHERTGDYPHVVWSEASEEVWYKYIKSLKIIGNKNLDIN